MKYLLDTDIVSQGTKPQPHAGALGWLGRVAPADTGLSAITIQEVRAGIEAMAAGARRRAVEHWLVNDLLHGFRERIVPVDAVIADECGKLVHRTRQSGYTPELGDALIAATALVHGLKVVTLNRKHFERLGVELVSF